MQLFRCILPFLLGAPLLGALENWPEYSLQARKEIEEVGKKKQVKALVISLGRTCRVARLCQKTKLRSYAFPFDWIVTPFSSLCELIENDFEGFFNFKHFTRWVEGKQIINTRYDFYFPHEPIHLEDWSDSSEGLLPKTEQAQNSYRETQEKYNRRIARFYEAFASTIPLYLVREDITKDETIYLYELLKKRFPFKTFTVIGVERHFTGSTNIDTPHLKFYAVKKEDSHLSEKDERFLNKALSKIR